MVSHNPFRQVMVLITTVILLSAFIHAEDTLTLITAPNFDQANNRIKLVKEDAWYTGKAVNSDFGKQEIWLNPDPRQDKTLFDSNIGKIIYQDEAQQSHVQFKYAGYGMISFETSFTFQIITTKPYPDCGSGMVFFIADYYEAPKGCYGRYFGLVSPDSNSNSNSRFFAIEFDTHIPEEFADPSASHIGIDIDSLKSKKFVDTSSTSSSGFYPELDQYSNATFTAWIKYRTTETLIEVWMSPTNLSVGPPVRPLSPCLSLQFNLSDVFKDYMYVGLPASNNASEDGMQGVGISAWNLTVHPPSESEDKMRKLWVIFGVVASVVVVVVVGFLVCYIWKKVSKRKAAEQQPETPRRESTCMLLSDVIGQTTWKEYSLDELRKASQDFCVSNVVGEGAFGIVYKATLEDGKTIAIKRMKARFRGEVEFSAEIRVISEIRHKNLLALRGWCYDKGEALLIYDYMSRGSLCRYIYGEDKGSLSSRVRLDIVAGVAAALGYLHEDLEKCVLHRDVKAGNVLLSEDWRPVLGDFGLARLVSHSEESVSMSVAGSRGYIAPEVVSGKVTPKADVYSFGVLLLVVACGRPALPSSSMRGSEPSVSLVQWIWELHQSKQIMECLDFALVRDMAEVEKGQWRRILHIAMACTDTLSRLRPTMRQVCQALEGKDFEWMHDRPATGPHHQESQRHGASSSRVAETECVSGSRVSR